jgi:hypothetical protein
MRSYANALEQLSDVSVEHLRDYLEYGSRQSTQSIDQVLESNLGAQGRHWVEAFDEQLGVLEARGVSLNNQTTLREVLAQYTLIRNS